MEVWSQISQISGLIRSLEAIAIAIAIAEGRQDRYLFSCPLIVDRYPQYGTRVVSSFGMNLVGLLVKALVTSVNLQVAHGRPAVHGLPTAHGGPTIPAPDPWVLDPEPVLPTRVRRASDEWRADKVAERGLAASVFMCYTTK